MPDQVDFDEEMSEHDSVKSDGLGNSRASDRASRSSLHEAPSREQSLRFVQYNAQTRPYRQIWTTDPHATSRVNRTL